MAKTDKDRTKEISVFFFFFNVKNTCTVVQCSLARLSKQLLNCILKFVKSKENVKKEPNKSQN